MIDSLAEGAVRHLSDVRRLVPGAQVILQVDEPALPAVLAGSLPTASGYGRARSVDPLVVLGGLQAVLAAHDGPTVVHCCHPGAPIPLLRAAGVGALALDLTEATPTVWESLAVSIEAGVGLYAGVLPTDGSGSVTAACRLVSDGFERVGLAADVAHERDAVAELLEDLQRLALADFCAGCIAGLHEVLRRQGLLEGIWCLDEHETLSPGQLDEIDRVCRSYPHLHDDDFVAAHRDEWLD